MTPAHPKIAQLTGEILVLIEAIQGDRRIPDPSYCTRWIIIWKCCRIKHQQRFGMTWSQAVEAGLDECVPCLFYCLRNRVCSPGNVVHGDCPFSYSDW